MKKIITSTCMVILICFAGKSIAQNINRAAVSPGQRNIVTINAGFDHGMIAGFGYGYQLKTKIPVMLRAGYSFPSGKKMFDDFKTKVGGNIELYKINNFRLSADIDGIFRRYENAEARLLNFGAELSAIAGYYKHSWYIAGVFGFDKAITTQFKHSAEYRKNYPDARDGWYIPTGGNFKYGLQGGYSFKSYDVNLAVGKTIAEDFRSASLVPYYLQLGINYRF